jgi:SAM-dependent methyltransferase
MLASESRIEFYRRWSRLAKPYIRWQFEQFEPYLGRRVADVGCGLGNFTPFLLDRELYLGVEPDQELLGEFMKRYGNHSRVRTASVDATSSEFREALAAHRVDSILCVNVLEHIENDALALKTMTDALPESGILCILVPALPVLYGSLDIVAEHHRRYSRKMLQDAFQRLPLDLYMLKYFNLIAAPGWFIKGRILKQTKHTNDNYHLMNAMLPWARRLEMWFSPPLGLSLVSALGKRK